MKKLAYFKIQENMTPRSAAEALSIAASSGCGDIIILHEDGAELARASYKEKLLSVFRAAFRHKVNLYIADDSFPYSGTGFSQVSSVRDTWQKMLSVVNAAEAGEEEILAEKDGKCVIAICPEENETYPYGHYPDLTSEHTALMVVESVYMPIMREYNKFSGYELKGFVCRMPLYDSLDGTAVPYSKAAMEKFEAKYKRKPDAFSLAERGADYEKYEAILRKCMEESFILPLKKYCTEHGMELIIQGGKKSVSYEFCKKENLIYLTEDLSENGCLMGVASASAALGAYFKKMGVCMAIMPGMDKIAQLGSFFEKHSSARITPVEEFIADDSDCYVLTNMTPKTKELGFLLNGDWVICDWEKDDIYDFGKKKTYKFYPYSFLCIKRKTKEMYSDNLPVRAGGVVIGDWQEEKKLTFTCENDIITFTLPEASLSGKCIEFIGDCGCLKVKMGYNEHSFVTDGRVLPLYDFLCGAECTAKVYDGKINEIRILG